MSKETKQLTKKQQRNKYRRTQVACRVGEFLVLPIPFAALMIANRDEWFNLPDNGWKIGIGASLTIALLVGAIIGVMIENKDKNIDLGFPLLIIKWIMAAIIITIIEDVLHQISYIMWVGLSGLAGSYGLDITRKQFTKKADLIQSEIDAATHELGTEQARREIEEEKKQKVRVIIKK